MAYGITAIAELNNRLMPDLPGCPSALITQTTLDVMRDFCIQTECWQEVITQTLTASTVAYTLTSANTDADIRRIVWLKRRNTAIDVLDEISETDPALYEFNGITGLTLNNTIKPTATVATGLVTKVVDVPKINATAWDSGLMNRYADAIVAGVKASLMDNEKEGWGNPRRAADFTMKYRNAVSLAKGEYYRKHKTGNLQCVHKDWL